MRAATMRQPLPSLEGLRKPALKDMCRQLGLKVSGTSAELIQRLRESSQAPLPPLKSGVDYASNKNKTLSKMCKQRGLAKSGNKAQLVARLEAFDAAQQAAQPSSSPVTTTTTRNAERLRRRSAGPLAAAAHARAAARRAAKESSSLSPEALTTALPPADLRLEESESEAAISRIRTPPVLRQRLWAEDDAAAASAAAAAVAADAAVESSDTIDGGELAATPSFRAHTPAALSLEVQSWAFDVDDGFLLIGGEGEHVLGDGELGSVRAAWLLDEPVAAKSFHALLLHAGPDASTGGSSSSAEHDAALRDRVRDAEGLDEGRVAIIELLRHELFECAKIEHENLTRLRGVAFARVATPAGDLLTPQWICVELCTGGSLRARLCGEWTATAPSLLEIVHVASGVARALTCIHAVGAAHRDVAPRHILFDGQGIVKLAGIGMARVAHRLARRAEASAQREARAEKKKKMNPATSTLSLLPLPLVSAASAAMRCGTPAYAAPEALVAGVWVGAASLSAEGGGEVVPSGSTPASRDVYALGLVIVEMVLGAPPAVDDVFARDGQIDLAMERLAPICPRLADAIRGCTTHNATQRLLAPELVDILTAIEDSERVKMSASEAEEEAVANGYGCLLSFSKFRLSLYISILTRLLVLCILLPYLCSIRYAGQRHRHAYTTLNTAASLARAAAEAAATTLHVEQVGDDFRTRARAVRMGLAKGRVACEDEKERVGRELGEIEDLRAAVRALEVRRRQTKLKYPGV